MTVLVVGTGSIGLRHLRNLRSLGAGRLLAFDADAAARSRAAQETGAEIVTSLDDGLAAAPEAVLVCTPTDLHVPVARRAMAAGAHVFVEKPIATSPADAAALVREARARGRVVLVGCNMRFHPGVATLKAALADGLIRDARIFRAWFSHYLPNWRPGSDYRQTYSARAAQGGGILLEAIHELDYLLWFGGAIAAVEAFTAHVSDLEIDVEDVALLFIRYASGAAGAVHLDCLRPVKARGCEVTGASGVVVWTSDGRSPERILVRHFDAGSNRWQDLLSLDTYDSNEMYMAEMRHFLACVRGDEPPLLDGETATHLLSLALDARARAAAADSRPRN